MGKWSHNVRKWLGNHKKKKKKKGVLFSTQSLENFHNYFCSLISFKGIDWKKVKMLFRSEVQMVPVK